MRLIGKGFIGPVGDDIPTILIIVMAITLFFAGFGYALQLYSEKNERLMMLKASLDISRALLRSTVLPENPMDPKYSGHKQASLLAQSYGVKFSAVYKEENFDPAADCHVPPGRDVTVMSFLTARKDADGNIVLDTLRVCVWK